MTVTPIFRTFACPRVMWPGAFRRSACLPLLRHTFIPLLCGLSFLSAPSLAAQDKRDQDPQSSNFRGSGIKFNGAAASPSQDQRNRAQGLHIFSVAGNTNAANNNGAAHTRSSRRPGQR